MEEFTLIFRIPRQSLPSEEDMRGIMIDWNNWLAGIAHEQKYVSGVRLGRAGKILRTGGVVTDGPFAELKEDLGGFIIIRAADVNEAIKIAQGCPVFRLGGNIEIRPNLPEK